MHLNEINHPSCEIWSDMTLSVLFILNNIFAIVFRINSWRSTREEQQTSLYGDLNFYSIRATSSDTKVRTIVTLVPAEQGRLRVKLRHLNFDPYPSRTQAETWVTLSYSHNNAHVLIMRRWKWLGIKNESRFWGVSTIKWNSYPTIL